MAKRKKEGWWSVRELRRNAPKFPVDSCREGHRPAFHGAGKTFSDPLAKKLVALEGDWSILLAKMKIPIQVRALTGVLILAGLAALPSRAAVIVYNNDFGGVISGDDFVLDSWEITGYSVADSFSLGTSTSLTGINLAL
jgi:hypothetical protein